MQYSSCEKVARLFRIQGAKPSVDILEDIAEHFEELNIRWLVTGQGEMLLPVISGAEEGPPGLLLEDLCAGQSLENR